MKQTHLRHSAAWTLLTTALSMLFLCTVPALSQTAADSTDMYFHHLQLNEVVVTGLTGDSRLKDMPAPVSIVSETDLQTIPSTNIFDRAYQNHLSRLKYIGTDPLTGERGICDMGRNFTVRLIVPVL